MSWAQRQWLLVIVGMAGLLGTLTMTQVLVARRGWRLDLTEGRQYVLSDYARRILGELDRDIRVTAFLRDNDPRNGEIEDLLWRVGVVAPHVTYQLVDVNRNPAVARRYGVRSYGAVAVESDGRRKIVPTADEPSLMAAIVQVTRPMQRRVYMLTGHGERSINETDRNTGYSLARAALVQELSDVAELAVLNDRPVPDDARVLIIAGPRSDLLTSELLTLDAYLRRGGNVLILLDPGNAPGLAAFLRRYGVVVGDDVVLDPENRLFAGDFLTMVVREHASGHPVTAGLRAEPLMSRVRPVAMASAADGVGMELLKTAAVSWRSGDPTVFATGIGVFTAGRDQPGPISVGVALRVPGIDGRSGRMIVYGDSDFATNFFLDYLGNRDLLLNSINWLSGDEQLIASRRPAQQPGINQFFVSARQGSLAFWIGTVIQPALVLAIGVAVSITRRRRA
jgi:ABC-type uncharacterized transport system involved in gliding motility auxiliary subunit